MTREVRINLIFIGALVLLLAPGFVFLMKKKLSDTSGRSNFMPEAAPYRIAYIQPLPAPPVPRKQPKLVRDWVTRLAVEHFGEEVGESGRRPFATNPFVSDRFVTECVGTFPLDGRQRVVLLQWEDNVNLSTTPSTAVRVFDENDVGVDCQTAAVERVDVPPDVRHALQDVGYVDPPVHVWWIAADKPASAGTAVQRIVLTTAGPDGVAVADSITLKVRPDRPVIEVTP